MLQDVRSYATDEHLYYKNAGPRCDEDFCESCGECLACAPSNRCLINSGSHVWIKYGKESQ